MTNVIKPLESEYLTVQMYKKLTITAVDLYYKQLC